MRRQPKANLGRERGILLPWDGRETPKVERRILKVTEWLPRELWGAGGGAGPPGN